MLRNYAKIITMVINVMIKCVKNATRWGEYFEQGVRGRVDEKNVNLPNSLP